MKLLTLCSLLFVFVSSNQIANIGDSWGTGGFDRLIKHVLNPQIQRKCIFNFLIFRF
jgi:hypothetical protein